ncbi:MAG: D-glycero-beta-D-manno-heptose 1,7-bisphosphate 7-phosphatase [Sodalis sp. (in: enterobacteria)]
MRRLVSAIFLDRDGTINIDNDYVYQINDFHFIEGVIEAMQKLKKMGFSLVLVTNQSGLARGLFSKEQFMRLMEWMESILAKFCFSLDGVYFCPHHPQAAPQALHKGCDCRKPKPGMLLDAQRDLNIDMASSYMVGDKMDDMLAGEAAGVGKRILVCSGKKVTEEARAISDLVINSLAILPAAIKKRQSDMLRFINY